MVTRIGWVVVVMVGCSGPGGSTDAAVPASNTADAAETQNGSDAGSLPDAAVILDAGDLRDAALPDAAILCGANPCLRAGEACTDSAQCQGDCVPALLGDMSQKVCVEPCLNQGQCDGVGLRLYCAPSSAGAAEGRCIPRSPAHCVACQTNADCGIFQEVCAELPDARGTACLVDCSISGAAACPDDYACVELNVNGTTRSLCRPVGDCLDNQGGFCDRYTTEPACDRSTDAGVCAGSRTCQPSGRFSACTAPEPNCLTSCSAQPEPGCQVAVCASALLGAAACGNCSNNCNTQTNPNTANAECNGGQCGWSCKGERYNVDGDFSDGCEDTDAPTGNHTQVTSLNVGVFDSCENAASMFSFGGVVISDEAVHENPVVASFDALMGYSPDWFRVQGLGNCPGVTCICSNDYDVTLTINGSDMPECYRLAFDDLLCDTDVTGTCTLTAGIGSYENAEVLYGRVEKTCSSAELSERVTYVVSGHL